MARLSRAGLPLLVVLTTQEEALEDRVLERAALDELVSMPRVDELGPLGADEHQPLIESMLGLEAVLGRRGPDRRQS